MAKVFSLPDIEVGSILEYRYHVRFEDNYFISPEWLIQSKLFTRKAHYQWRPTVHSLYTREKGQINSVQWLPLLPAGDTVKLQSYPPVGQQGPRTVITLDIANIPPIPDEEYLPPILFASYRVLFYYSEYNNNTEFWAKEGKNWSKEKDKFIGPGPAVKAAAQELAPASEPPLDRLRKLYAGVMKLENTDFTREHTASEEKADGNKEVRNTDDVLTRKRGSGAQLTELFIALARAAGFKAYLATVTSRDHRIFLQGFLSLKQLDGDLAIVQVDGKDLFFDPGERYMPFQHLAWSHTLTRGLRQTDKGADFVDAPGETFKFSHIQRLADLQLDAHGEASGSVRFIYSGDTALDWRQRALRGDDTSLHRQLSESCERLFGKGTEVRVVSVEKLTDYEEPLTVAFSVKGPVGSTAGHRLLISSDLFEGLQDPTFAAKERKYAVYFHYPYFSQDVVRIHYPPSMSVESMPKPLNTQFQKIASYGMRLEQGSSYYTIRRDLAVGEVLFPMEQYSDLHTFYTGFEAQDREPVVLKSNPVAVPSGGN